MPLIERFNRIKFKLKGFFYININKSIKQKSKVINISRRSSIYRIIPYRRTINVV